MTEQRPLNLLILISDQHRHDALRCVASDDGSDQRTWLTGHVQTPHLDRLAASGVRFTQAVANLPVCVPSRHSFITGLYPYQTGVLTNGHYWPGQPPVPTLAMRLSEAQYSTAAIGKMHWKNQRAPAEHVPDKRGFALRASLEHASDGPYDKHYDEAIAADEGWLPANAFAHFGLGGETREGYIGAVAPVGGAHLPEAWLTEQAIGFLREHADGADERPFCLLLSLDRPHPPNVVPADYAERYAPDEMPLPPATPPGFAEDDYHIGKEIATREWNTMTPQELRLSVSRYLANVSYVDAQFGRVLATLEETGQADKTMVVYFSDHGELLGERGGGHTKYCLYESAIRVPLLVRWPGVSQAGLVSSAPVELIDLLPTWLEAAGLPVPNFLPGRSLRQLLAGESPREIGWREATFTEQYTAVATPGAPRTQWALREHRYKLIERVSGQSALYDLQEDPMEYHNLIDDPTLAPVRERLRTQLLHDMMARTEQYPAQNWPQVAIARPPARSQRAG